jgi:hypothetical protein
MLAPINKDDEITQHLSLNPLQQKLPPKKNKRKVWSN